MTETSRQTDAQRIKVALVNDGEPLSFLAGPLQRALPDMDLCLWPDAAAMRAEVAVCWRPPEGLLAAMPRLRLIHSIGAGVDGLVRDPSLPPLPVCRVVDPTLGTAMAEFVLWGTLYFHRRFDEVMANARRARWERLEQKAAAQVRVGILGLGALGREAAGLLTRVGYTVAGWSRSPKEIEGIAVHAGDAALPGFLAATDILVCLLPLTPETEGILNRRNLGLLPEGAAVILCSRGQHLVVEDFLALRRSGHLKGAILDVFEAEPLPPDHPLWREPGVLVTPHMAGLAKPRAIADQIAENIRRLRAGEDFLNRVDVARGY